MLPCAGQRLQLDDELGCEKTQEGSFDYSPQRSVLCRDYLQETGTVSGEPIDTFPAFCDVKSRLNFAVSFLPRKDEMNFQKNGSIKQYFVHLMT